MSRGTEVQSPQNRTGTTRFLRRAASAIWAILALPRASWACGGPDPLAFLIGFPLILSIILFVCISIVAAPFSRKDPSFKKIYLCMLVFTFLLMSLTSTGGGGGTTAAEASNIVSELRNMKAAAMMLFADHPDSVDFPPSALQNHVEALKPYLDNTEKIKPEHYTFRTGTSSRAWWIGYRTDDVRTEIMEKLAGRAKNTGLYGSPRFDMPPIAPHESLFYKTGDGAVWNVLPRL